MNRQVISSGAPWESIVGYSRAVRIGNRVEVSGTAPVIDGVTVRKDDMYAQTKNCLEIIERALKEAGAEMKDVVRTRSYITDISRWEDYGRAHAEYFKAIKPATTLVEVSNLISPDMLIEIEVVAVIES